MIAFLLQSGWKKQGPKRPGRGGKEKEKQDYEVEAGKIRKTISIAKAQLERLRSNKKLTKKGKRNRAILKEECKHFTAAELINYMERKKALLRTLKKVNQKFKLDAGQVYAHMRAVPDIDKENERPRLKNLKSGFPQISTKWWHKSKNRFRGYFTHR